MFEAWKAQKKQQIVYEIDKIVATMHTLIFADGALGAKNARDCSQKQYFERGTEGKMAIGTAKRAKIANIITKISGLTIVIIMINALLIAHSNWSIFIGERGSILFASEQLFLLILGFFFFIRGNNT